MRKPATEKRVVAIIVASKPGKNISKADDKTGDKVLRASFTLPQSDYAKIVELKQA